VPPECAQQLACGHIPQFDLSRFGVCLAPTPALAGGMLGIRRLQPVAISPDGRTLVSAGRFVNLWDLATGQFRSRLNGLPIEATSVGLTFDGQTSAVASTDKNIRLWSAKTSKLLRTVNTNYKNIKSLVIAPGGRTLALGGDNIVQIWDPESGSLLRTLETQSTVAYKGGGGKTGFIHLGILLMDDYWPLAIMMAQLSSGK
jgi:WD40 repeat protein